MKFAEHLSSHLTPEWRKQYIQYDKMKDMLYDLLDKAPVSDFSVRDSFIQDKDLEFFRFAEHELYKINLFFSKKLAEAKMRFVELKERLEKSMPVIEAADKSYGAASVLRRSTTYIAAKKSAKHTADLKFAYTEFYLSLILIQNFQEMNFTGFRKIMKKHDKLLEIGDGQEWRRVHVFNANFYTNKEVDKLIEDTENIVINVLEGGDRTRAMKRLRVQPMSEIQSPWSTFRLGLFVGSFVILVGIICFTVYFKPLPHEIPWVGVRLFRGFFFIFLFAFLVGANMYGWQKAGVNHVLIFEIDPRKHLTYQTLMEISAMFLVIWAWCVMGYLYHDVIKIPKLSMPLLLMFVSVTWLLNPFNFGYKSARWWFLKKVFICFSPLCNPVLFADFWLADQMNSMVTFFLDMEYFVCFYSMEVDWGDHMRIRNLTAGEWPGVDPFSGKDTCNTAVLGIRPVISVIPAAIRFLQCIRRYVDSKHRHPHITNAGKYSTTFFVVLFGTLRTWYKARHSGLSDSENPFFYIWVVAYVISTCYTYTWDVKMDWGLLECSEHAKEHPMLREELVYDYLFYYYGAIALNFLLRMAWTLNVSLGELWITGADYLVTITGLLECFRRCIWNFFRLENEHLNNCGEFRAVRDISLRPIPHIPDADELKENARKLKLRRRPSAMNAETLAAAVGKIAGVGGAMNNRHYLKNGHLSAPKMSRISSLVTNLKGGLMQAARRGSASSMGHEKSGSMLDVPMEEQFEEDDGPIRMTSPAGLQSGLYSATAPGLPQQLLDGTQTDRPDRSGAGGGKTRLTVDEYGRITTPKMTKPFLKRNKHTRHILDDDLSSQMSIDDFNQKTV